MKTTKLSLSQIGSESAYHSTPTFGPRMKTNGSSSETSETLNPDEIG